MYLEVIECLNNVNRSIYGLPVIVSFVIGNICEIIRTMYSHILFPRDYFSKSFTHYQYYLARAIILLLMKIVNVIMLYVIGHVTEKEVFKNYF